MNLLYQLKKDLTNLLNMVLVGNIDEETRKSYQYFSIELSKKELKRNERYKDRVITVYNLYRQEDEIVNSLIIGLAHHIDWCNRGETGTKNAGKPFLTLYETMLFEALDEGLLSFEELKASRDYENIKLIRDITSTYFPPEQLKKRCILEVYSCFPIKDYLKSQGFSYNQIHRSWDIEVDTNSVARLQQVIIEKCKTAEIKTRDINKIIFGLPAKVCISGNTYKYKEILRENKYYFENQKWCKKIQANMYLQEKQIIEKLIPAGQGLKISIEY